MGKFEPMISLDEAYGTIDRTLAGTTPISETIPVRKALGRVTAADQISRLDLPPFDKSAMDGYAVLLGDEREEYVLVETVRAGRIASRPLVPGAAIKVMTGAAVPDGAGKVIILEHCEEEGDRVRVLKSDTAANICRRGEDVRAGDVLLRAGTRLGPVEIANLIACGITEVEVAKRTRVAVLSTGDEIVDSPEAITPGRIMNSNGPMLTALAARHGLEVMSEQSIADDREATKAAIAEAARSSDIVILTGGVSVGEYDFVLEALSALGLTVHFSRIAVQPGKPTAYATAADRAPQQTVVFGLPGNPVSVFLMFHLLVLRAACWLTGRRPAVREFVLPLASAFNRRKSDRVSFVPARLTKNGAVEPVAFHGSAHLAALMSADGFAKIPAGVTEIAQGEEVVFLPVIGVED